MTESKDPYTILGVSRDATPEQIGKAYRKLAREHHPDMGGDPEVFKQLAWAWEILGDAAMKSRFDETGCTRDEAKEELEATIAGMVIQAFRNGYTDPIVATKDAIDNQRSLRKQDLSKLQHQLKTLDSKISKFEEVNAGTSNTEARDFIVGVLRSQISAIELSIQQAEHDVDLGNRMLTYLNDIRFGAEQPSRWCEKPLGSMRLTGWGTA